MKSDTLLLIILPFAIIALSICVSVLSNRIKELSRRITSVESVLSSKGNE